MTDTNGRIFRKTASTRGARELIAQRILFLLFTALLLLAGGAVHAGGRPEDDLVRAEDLIGRQRYDEALEILADVIRKDPDRFDAAESLISRIRSVQNGFNIRYAELVRVLYDDRDVERALDLIAELERLDPNPNEATLRLLEEARRGALIAASRNRFDRLMGEALGLLQGGDFVGAIDMYLTGFELNKGEFDAAGYGNIVVAAVGSALAGASASVERFLDLRQAFDDANTALAAALQGSGDSGGPDAALRAQVGRLAAIGETIASLEAAADALASQRQVVERGRSTPENHLYYAERVIRGRPGQEEDEGLRRAELLFFQDANRGLVSALQLAARTGREAALAAFEAGAWEEARRAYVRVQPFARALMEGVPPHDRDRPANVATAADWIRQCRRAGLYEFGRVLYEKGGFNFSELSDEGQLEVEEDYQICVRRSG